MKIEPELREIPITIIDIHSKYRDRKMKADVLTRESERVKSGRIISPLLVRRLNDDRFEVVTGQRRLAIAQAAELKTITCAIFDDEPELVEKMQLLDWIHDIGEHDILRHPDAYQFYLQKKSELLKRELPPELLTEEAWQKFVKTAVEESLQAMLYKLWGEAHKEFLDKLSSWFEEYSEHDELNEMATQIADEAFKVSMLKGCASKVIEIMIDLLQGEAKEDLSWVDEIPVHLETPSELTSLISINEATGIFNRDDNQLSLYKRGILSTVRASDMITLKQDIRARIGMNRSLANNQGYGFCDSFLNEVTDIIRRYSGQNYRNIVNDLDIPAVCHRDFRNRLQNQLKPLYDKVRRDEKQGQVIDQAYIRACFHALNIPQKIYQPLRLVEREIIPAVLTDIENLFVAKILQARSNQNKVRYYLQYYAEKARTDYDIKGALIEVFNRQMLEKRNALDIGYQFADSQLLKVTSSAELLGTLLFMHRSYKHYIKQRLSEKPIFFKKRLRFSTIESDLQKDRALDLADGLSEFIFMIDMSELGAVTTKLKVFNTGNFDYHVQQFQSYCKASLSKPVEAGLEQDEITTKKSTFYEMAAAMVKKGNPAPKGAEIDRTLSQWMGACLKLMVPDIATHFPVSTRDSLLRLFRVYTFMMFYIEGIRNPGAFVLHPLVLKELIDVPLAELDNYIATSRFIMTRGGAKQEGQQLQRIFRPSVNNDKFKKELVDFNCTGMAKDEADIVATVNANHDTSDIENQVLAMFCLAIR